MKILNLYAGIGGNRKLWGDEHDITAVEYNEDIAAIYQDFYPNDKVIVGDAHEYLLKNYKEFDFIWSSPPCQTHSSFRKNICVKFRGTKPKYPDMKLYQEIILLQTYFYGLWVVENVKPFYNPLINFSFSLQRHLYWSNFKVENKEFIKSKLRTAQISDLQKFLGLDLSKYKIKNKRQILRNCVLPEIGKYILDRAMQKPIIFEKSLFEEL